MLLSVFVEVICNESAYNGGDVEGAIKLSLLRARIVLKKSVRNHSPLSSMEKLYDVKRGSKGMSGMEEDCELVNCRGCENSRVKGRRM